MTSMCWTAFYFITHAINPETTNWYGFLLFYLALFLALSGTAAILGFFIRFVGIGQDLAFRSVKAAFRQSFLFAGFFVAVLILLSQGLFTWMNVALLIISLSVLELFLISCRK